MTRHVMFLLPERLSSNIMDYTRSPFPAADTMNWTISSVLQNPAQNVNEMWRSRPFPLKLEQMNSEIKIDVAKDKEKTNVARTSPHWSNVADIIASAPSVNGLAVP